jgi:hypothetical protein
MVGRNADGFGINSTFLHGKISAAAARCSVAFLQQILEIYIFVPFAASDIPF